MSKRIQKKISENLTKNGGKKIKNTVQKFNELRNEYDILKATGADISFQEYYNLPTYDKVSLSLQSRLGTPPTRQQVEKALEASKEGATGLKGILSPVTSFIRNVFTVALQTANKAPVMVSKD